MKKSIYIKESIIAILLVFTSCMNPVVNDQSQSCVELNNKGVQYLMDYPMNGAKGLEMAIELIKKAIICDSNNVVFYNSLASAYGEEHNYNEEMKVVNKILALTNAPPRILMNKGMLYEIMNKRDSAEHIYMLTRRKYEKHLKLESNNVQLIKDWILFQGITKGKETAIKTLKREIEVHPEFSVELSKQIWFYENFDRHSFVFRLPTVTDLDNK